MAGQDIRQINRKYARQKMIRETMTAWAFLLPNFIGFIVITFLPIFAALLLSFTEWDGTSSFVPKPESARFAFKLDAPVSNESFTIKKGTLLKTKTLSYETKEFSLTIPYVLTRDIVVPANQNEYPLVDLSSLLMKYSTTSYDEQSNLILAVAKEKLDKDVLPYMKEGGIFGPKDGNSLSYNIRVDDSTTAKGVNAFINMNYSGREVCIMVPKSASPFTVPKGTILLADVYIKKIASISTNHWQFVLDKDVTISAGKTENSNPVELWSDKGGEIKMHVGDELQMSPAVSNVKAYVKSSGSDMNRNSAGVKGGLGNNGLKWVGVSNYRKILFNDSRFWDYMFNTFFFLLQIPIGMTISLIMALAMNQPLKGIVVFRVIYFLPVISNIVAVAVVWRFVFNADVGILNTLLHAIGVANPPRWFGDTLWAKIGIIIVDTWKGAGYNMMLYLAGLQGIPHDLYEAADIDGATPWQQFWAITWPLLGPTNFFILITGVIGGFQAFGTQFVIAAGGPAGATTTIVYYIYMNAYQWYKMGYATAIAMVLFVFIMAITALQWFLSEKNVEY